MRYTLMVVTGAAHATHSATVPTPALIAVSFVAGAVLLGALGFVLGTRQRAGSSESSPTETIPTTSDVELSRLQAENEQVRQELSRMRGVSQPAMATGDERWVELAQGCADLYTELADLSTRTAGTERELLGHTCGRLEQVLAQSGVEVIAQDMRFDRQRHKPVPPAAPAPGSAILETVSPGFAVGRRVLRRAVARVQAGR